jgi:hypothetical protein
MYSLCKYFKITEGSIELGCNGLSALTQAFMQYAPHSVDCPSYDLIMAIQNLRHKTGISLTHKYVAGHQDDHKEWSRLTRVAQVNVQADILVKQHLRYAKARPQHYVILGKPWSVYFNNKKLLELTKGMYKCVHSPEALDYWQKSKQIPPEAFDYIHWEAIGQAMTGLERLRQHYIAKHNMDMCGVVKWMKRWKERDTDACPRCGMSEDATHVLSCQGGNANEYWEQSIRALSSWMHSVLTDPDINKAIITGLNNWRFKTMHPFPITPCLKVCLDQQQDIGWEGLLEGWIPFEWEEAQQKYYSAISSQRSGKRWIVGLLHQLWTVSHTLWDHRNQVLHENTNVVSTRKQQQRDLNIKRLFRRLLITTLDPCNKFLLNYDLKTHLTKSMTFKEGWLRSAKVLMKHNIVKSRSSLQQIRRMRNNMRNWLQTGTNVK